MAHAETMHLRTSRTVKLAARGSEHFSVMWLACSLFRAAGAGAFFRS